MLVLVLELLILRKMLDLSEVTWNETKVSQTEGRASSHNTKQTSLIPPNELKISKFFIH
jgi:hypothetical protein